MSDLGRGPLHAPPAAILGQLGLRLRRQFPPGSRQVRLGRRGPGQHAATFYRLDELDRNWSGLPYVSAFAEYRPDRKTTLSFSLDNATDVPGLRRRTFFEPDRRTLTPDAVEHRNRNKHIVPALSFKRNFG